MTTDKIIDADKPLEPKARKLTRKQKRFADYLLKHPKARPKEAAMEAYDKTSDHSYEVIASDNLKKVEILNYLNEHDVEAQNTVISVMVNATKKKDEAQFQKLALDSANSVLDRIHGKAKQTVDSSSTVVNLNVEATQELNDAFTKFLTESTQQQ